MCAQGKICAEDQRLIDLNERRQVVDQVLHAHGTAGAEEDVGARCRAVQIRGVVELA